LLLYGGMQEEIFPSETKLSENHHRSVRQIRNVLYKLRDKGFIIYWERRGYSLSNRYTLNEELFYRNEGVRKNAEEKSISSYLGNEFPIQTGNVIPPNINQEINNKEDNNNSVLSNAETNFLNKKCSNPFCENGIVYVGNKAIICKECGRYPIS